MELTRKNIKGSMVALVTPLRDGKLDETALKRLIDFHINEGTDVLVPCGTTGESATMTHEEHKRVMAFVVDYVKGRVPVICGAGSNCTEEALPLIRHAKSVGASAVLVVTPYYNKPTQEGLYRHYEFLAKKVDISIVVYNVPGRTGVSIASETVARLAKFPNIVAVKEASGNLDQAGNIMSLCDVPVLSGEDSLTYPMMCMGAKGVISVVANVAPRKMHDMCEAVLNENYDEARKLHYELFPLSKVLFIETNPIPVKTALGLMGMINTEFRLPLCEMGSENQKKLEAVLKDTGLLSAKKKSLKVS